MLATWLSRLESRYAGIPVTSLAAVKTVAERLQLLPVPYPVITVTGTNGKGSTVTACEHVLQAAGYRVGAFTSPHLLRFTERMRVGAVEVTETALLEAFAAVEAARGEIPLNYFQFITLAALWWFARERIDVAVLEVGIGGRLDAVNIVDADVAVITNIGLDHQGILGQTRAEIGLEKIGIARAGKPLILGADMPPEVWAAAADLKAIVYQQPRDYYAEAQGECWSWHYRRQAANGSVTAGQLDDLPVPKIALSNAANALMAIMALGMPVSPVAIEQGLRSTQIPARIQIVQRHCQVVVDVAHNVESMQHLVAWLAAHPSAGQTHVVFSALADKDVRGMMALMPPSVHWYLAALEGPRALSLSALIAALPVAARYQTSADIKTAFAAALHHAKPEDRVVICGSFRVAAGVL